jgi:hypothetical protein
MSYADLFVGILIIVLLVIVAVRVLSPRTAAQVGRTIWRDERGSVVAIGERQGTPPGQWSGRGTQTSPPMQLAPGSYRIDYQFAALTRLALLDATGFEDTLFIKRDTGTEMLTLAEAGRYRLVIEPTDEGAAWSIAYRPVMALGADANPPEIGTL